MAVLQPRVAFTIVGDFAMYIGGKLTAHPDLITILSLSPAKVVSRNFRLVTNFPISSFFDKLDFLYMPTYSRPGSNMFYTVWYGNEITALRLAIVNS